MKLCGLIGFAGSGKTSIAKAMTGWTRLAFADVLKRKAASALGIGVDELEARKGEFRPLLVELGKAGRLIDPMRWVIPVMDRIDNTLSDTVIDDCRYLNEIEAIRERGGECFFIQRSSVLFAANQEERDSIGAIIESRLWQSIQIIDNETTPADAAAKVLEGMK